MEDALHVRWLHRQGLEIGSTKFQGLGAKGYRGYDGRDNAKEADLGVEKTIIGAKERK